MGYLAFGAALAASAGGGVAYAARQTAPLREWAAQLAEADAALLDQGQALPPIPEPERPRPRAQWNLVVCYAVGLGIGLALGFTVVFAAVVLFHTTAVHDQPLIGGVILGAVFGVMGAIGGLIIPGVPIAILLYLRETRARMQAMITAGRWEVWWQREERRDALRKGRADPAVVAMELRGER